MCYFNSLAAEAKTIALRYGKKTPAKFGAELPAYVAKAFASPKYPVITSAEDIETFLWGLRPFWLKPKKDESPEDFGKRVKKFSLQTANARAETIFEKPSYREYIGSSRCLIPATGYFEYHHNPDKSTTPYYIFPKDGGIFSMGGIFSFWQDPESGEKVGTFSQITVPANDFVGEIHNGGANPRRMPLIFRQEEEAKWLDPKLGKGDIEQMMATLPEGTFDAYPVEKGLNKMAPGNPDAIKKVKYSLFD